MAQNDSVWRRLTMANSSPGVMFLKWILVCGGLLFVQQFAVLSRFHRTAVGQQDGTRALVLTSDTSRPNLPVIVKDADFDGVIPRAFERWPTDIPIPCFEPEPDWRNQQERPTNDGLVFIKPYKTGSSTASGIHLRISRNVARRQDDTSYQLCKSRFDHTQAAYMIPERQDQQHDGKSFLWSIIRDPTKRLVSLFFHMRVSRHKEEPSVAALREMIYDYLDGSLAHDYYLSTLSTHGYYPDGDFDPVETANAIIKDYDFIGVTERMDESAVALALLLRVPLGDVLYLKAKGNGGYDDGGGRGDTRICTYIWPGFLTKGMREVLEGEEWLELSQFDRALHQAANRSLDLTIDKLGREEFEASLALYRKAQDIAHERCFAKTVFPCSKEGNFTPDGLTDCLWNDSGCGYECLDQVATEMDLWKPHGPLEITEPEGFRYKPRMWCGLYEADSCAACIMEQKDHEPLCGGDCQWCRYGEGKEDGSMFNPSDTQTGQCVPAESKCRPAWVWPDSPATSESPPHLLDAPFYVYEELLWLDKAKVGEYSVEDWILNHQEIKHTDDWWFATAALDHPKRTMNPEEAKIFVVPTLINVIVDQLVEYDTELCFKDRCNLELLQASNRFLEKSQWFQRHAGRDHIVVASHYAAEWFVPDYENLMKCHMIGMEYRKWNDPNRTIMPSLYVGNSCKRRRLRAQEDDFALIATMPDDKPAFQSRKNVCQWIQRYRKGFSMTHCGQDRQCPGLAQARFGFHVRGDTYGSNRLMDTLLSATVPVFTLQEQYSVLPDWIDWKMLSYYANVIERTTFLSDLDIIAADDEGYGEKSTHVLENRDLFNWQTGIPFDTYLYMLSVHLWPQEEAVRRQNENVTTPYSALILPQLVVDPKSNNKNETGSNSNQAAIVKQQQQQPSFTSFRVFDPQYKVGVWCGGLNGPAPTCGDCTTPVGTVGEDACRGGCMWCEHGAVDEDEDDEERDDANDDDEDGDEASSRRRRRSIRGNSSSRVETSHSVDLTEHRTKCVHKSRSCRQRPPPVKSSFQHGGKKEKSHHFLPDQTTDTE